jgi:flavin reductase (DIM6/NTAB) family NADH-FMN oxidoreductase RutF
VDRPGTDIDAFRLAMRRVAATVNIVTTADPNGVWAGITATAMNSVSFDPPSLLVCVNRSASLHAALVARQLFCVNVLSAEQADIAARFAVAEDRALRFQHGDWREGRLGLPYLRGCCASLFCEVANLVEFGTHTVIIGIVVETIAAEGRQPLVYLDGCYLLSPPR